MPAGFLFDRIVYVCSLVAAELMVCEMQQMSGSEYWKEIIHRIRFLSDRKNCNIHYFFSV